MNELKICKGCDLPFPISCLCTNEETKRLECIHCYVAWRKTKEIKKETSTKVKPNIIDYCNICNRQTKEIYHIPRPTNNGMIRGDERICGFCMNLALKRMATK